MAKRLDLSGQKFGCLIALHVLPEKRGSTILWLCECTCKEKKRIKVATADLRNGHTKSCGCLNRSNHTIHGANSKQGRHPLYRIWMSMNERCYNKNNKVYNDYGGRGIKVCDEWRTYPPFRDYMLSLDNCPDNAEKAKSRLDRMIDRYPDNDGNYEPGNVRWATKKESANNRRTNRFIRVNGVRLTLKTAILKYGKAPYETVYGRLRKGWPLKEAFLTPSR